VKNPVGNEVEKAKVPIKCPIAEEVSGKIKAV